MLRDDVAGDPCDHFGIVAPEKALDPTTEQPGAVIFALIFHMPYFISGLATSYARLQAERVVSENKRVVFHNRLDEPQVFDSIHGMSVRISRRHPHASPVLDDAEHVNRLRSF